MFYYYLNWIDYRKALKQANIEFGLSHETLTKLVYTGVETTNFNLSGNSAQQIKLSEVVSPRGIILLVNITFFVVKRLL